MPDGPHMPDVFKADGPAGIPLWGWGAIVIGGALIGRKVAASWGGRATAAPQTMTSTGSDSYVATAGTATTGTTGGTGHRYETNVQWGAAAIDYAVGSGTSPVAASTAVARFLGGSSMTATDTAIVNNIIRGIGSPPEAVPEPSGTPVLGAPRLPRRDSIRVISGATGESANQAARRLSNMNYRTTTGTAMTGAYLATINGWDPRHLDKARTPGTRFTF